MSVAILIEYKAPDREALYIPVATQGVYSTEWVPRARKLGLKWMPLFRTGAPVPVEELPTVVDEFRRLRASLAAELNGAVHLERVDFILEELGTVDPESVASVFIG